MPPDLLNHEADALNEAALFWHLFECQNKTLRYSDLIRELAPSGALPFLDPERYFNRDALDRALRELLMKGAIFTEGSEGDDPSSFLSATAVYLTGLYNIR